MIIISLLLWCFFILLFLFFLLLVLPLHYQGQGKWQENLEATLEIRQGLWKITVDTTEQLQIALLGVTILKKPLAQEKSQKPKKLQKQKPAISGKVLRALLQKELGSEFLRLLGAILQNCRPRVFEINGSIGFEDPYYTGLWAAFTACIPQIRLAPDFSGDNKEIYFQLEGRFLPLVIVYYVLRFFFSSPTRKVWREIRAAKKEFKKTSPKNATPGTNPVYSTTKR